MPRAGAAAAQVLEQAYALGRDDPSVNLALADLVFEGGDLAASSRTLFVGAEVLRIERKASVTGRPRACPISAISRSSLDSGRDKLPKESQASMDWRRNCASTSAGATPRVCCITCRCPCASRPSPARSIAR